MSNYISETHCVRARVQNIALELNNGKISYEKYHVLVKRLDDELKNVYLIKKQASAIPFAQGTTDALEQEIISLFGRALTAWVKHEVDQIESEALVLEEALLAGKVSSQMVKKLSGRLGLFKKQHRPGVAERRIIARAEHIVDCAKKHLKGSSTAVLKQKATMHCFAEEEAFEIAQELMEIAGFIYYRDLSEAKMRYHQLPSTYKKRFLEHMDLLDADLFKDSFESIQACMALAGELVNSGDTYPTRSEIDELFYELSEVVGGETQEKIFSLRSKISGEG